MSGKGKIKLILAKPYYVAGERVDGTVDIDLAQPVQASAVKIKWAGYERTLIEMTLPNAEGEMKTEKFKDDNTFFKSEAILYQINQQMLPGHYNYPFSFQLPAGLPGIFFDERKVWGNDKVKAAIMYKVKVWLDVVGKDLKASEKITISEAVCREIKPMHDHKEKGFLLAKGKLKMDFWMDKNVFCPGEVAPIKVKIDNESSKKVNHIKIKLMRDLVIKAKHQSRTLTETLGCESYDGVGEKSKLEKTFNYTVPANVFPTANGKLVKCNYHLDIECDVPMAIDLEHHVPICLALMPTMPMALNIYASYTPHGW